VSAGRAFVVFAAALAAFHNLPPVAGETAGDYIDLATPFAVLGAALLVLLVLRADAASFAVAFVAGVLYADGHGIHLAANSIGHEQLSGEAADVTHFWDEEFGHIEWHLGWFGLVLAICLAERRLGGRAMPRLLAALSVVLLGFTLFADTVEGGTWWLELAATAILVGWAVNERRPLLLTSTAAFAAAAVLIGVWAVWHGGVPQFSEVGWL
jgi:hypothetical protein